MKHDMGQDQTKEDDWELAPKSRRGKDKAGTDFIVARNGRIASVHLFFDELPELDFKWIFACPRALAWQLISIRTQVEILNARGVAIQSEGLGGLPLGTTVNRTTLRSQT
jgi:hypothetical protein